MNELKKSTTIYHIHPCYPWHCGATDGIMATNSDYINCPACLALRTQQGQQ